MAVRTYLQRAALACLKLRTKPQWLRASVELKPSPAKRLKATCTTKWQLHEVKALLKNPPDVAKAITGLLKENSDLNKKLEAAQREKAGDVKEDLIASSEEVNGVKFIGSKVDLDPKSIKDLAFQLKATESTFVVLGADNGGKASITIGISDDLVKDRQLNAGQMIREVAKAIQGIDSELHRRGEEDVTTIRLDGAAE